MTGQLTLVTGGAKSGKSVFAEQQLSDDDRICYIATGVMTAPDPEMQLRIKTHQQRRSNNWTTEERYEDVAGFIHTHQFDGYLLDDATMLITNRFYQMMMAQADKQGRPLDDVIDQMGRDEIAEVGDVIFNDWDDIVLALRETDQAMFIVTNEVGLGIVPATKQTRILRDLYGQVNQRLAQAADHVYFVISGLPQKLK